MWARAQHDLDQDGGVSGERIFPKCWFAFERGYQHGASFCIELKLYECARSFR